MSLHPEFHTVIRPPSGRDLILVLLHGTGGDESSMLGLAEEVAPGAGVISPRGQSRDEGFNRWFRRYAEGLFDLEDLHAKTAELADYLTQEMESQGWNDLPLGLIGYSNGANMAGSLLLSGKIKAQKAVLLRPMLPFEPDYVPNLVGTKALLAVGQKDQICLPSQGLALEEVLVRTGARVEVYWAPSGHGLNQGDIETAREFLAG